MEWAAVAAAWGALMVATVWLASVRGHSILTWLVIALLLSPLLALPMLLVTPRKRDD